MMFKPFEESRGEALLMSYLEAFHAKTSQSRGGGRVLTGTEAECGVKWRGSFTKYSQDSCSWKTHQCSLLGDLEEFSETWPQWGLMRDGECWEQRTLERHIRGTGFGLSPNGVDSFHTPNTTGLDGGSNSRKALKKRLLPTPDASPRGPTKDYDPKAKSQSGRTLQSFVAKWPTPRATDFKGATSAEAMSKAAARGFSPNLPEATAASVGGGKLNPTWVEWLMGWPLGWTDLKPLETDKCHSVPQQLGES
jgi:DNA (cytosine-5)-methyltransferase 1